MKSTRTRLIGAPTIHGTPARGDTGSALVLALIVMTVCGVILASVLAFADARTRTTVALIDEGKSAAAADGATKAAITDLQNSDFNLQKDRLCFKKDGLPNGTEYLELPLFNGKDSAVVKCSAVTGTGAQSAKIKFTDDTRPGNSILTLGEKPDDGVYIRNRLLNALNGNFTINGSIFSKGTITADSGAIKLATPDGEESTEADLYAYASKGCTAPPKLPWPLEALSRKKGQILVGQSIPPKGTLDCTHSASDFDGDDPKYSLPVVDFDKPNSLPSLCKSGSRTAVFQPGYYDNVVALNAITNPASSSNRCDLIRFEKGNYYFDFHNGDHRAAVMGAASHVWTLNGSSTTRVVAGNLVNPSDPNSLCVDPTAEGNEGVRFVFGGNSRLVIDGVDTMICGTYVDETMPPLAIQGVRDGDETTTDPTSIYTAAQPFSWAKTNVGTTADPGNAAGNDDLVATWERTASTGNDTNTFSASGSTSVINKKRSVVTSVSLTYEAAKVSGSGSVSNRTVSVATAGLNPCSFSLTADGRGTKELTDITDNKDCKALVDLIATRAYAGTPLPLTVSYGVKITGKAKVGIDELQLKVQYRAPAFRTQNGAVAGDGCNLNGAFRPDYAKASDLESTTGCAGLTIQAENDTDFTIRGTIYLPYSAVNMNVKKFLRLPVGFKGDGLFGFGIVAKSLYANMAFNQTVSFASLPAFSIGSIPAAVLLETYVCPGAESCSITGKTPDLSARVIFTDKDSSKPKAGERKVNIQSWDQKQ